MEFYRSLGVKTLINALGTVTRIGGSLMAPEVVEAMADAATHFVELETLHREAGKHIAQLTGAAGCCITCGAAAGLAISAAACMTRGDIAKCRQLPDTTGMPDEILVLKCHRILYDQALLLSGARFVEVGTASCALPQQVEAAVSEKTALFFYAAECEGLRGSLPLEEIVPLMKKRGIPVVVDAAAELPPVSSLTDYLARGADLVVFSGGKELRGPQASGLVLGDERLTEACSANCCPNYGIGRCMKIDKENIAGIVRAVELFMAKDYDAQYREWTSMSEEMAAYIARRGGADVRTGYPSEPGVQPANILRVYIRPHQKMAWEVASELEKLDPQVYVGISGDELVLNPQCLTAEEARLVAQAVSGVL